MDARPPSKSYSTESKAANLDSRADDEMLAALDEPDRPYAQALGETLTTVLRAARQPHDAEATRSPHGTIAWLGHASHPAVGLVRDVANACNGRMCMLPIEHGGHLPQPPGPCVDVLVLGFALSCAGGRAGAVLGFAVRALSEASRHSRVVILDRIAAPLKAFVTETQGRLHPNESRRPHHAPALPMPRRLAWHAAWSPYSCADYEWLCDAFALSLELPIEIGNGRRYLVAQARPHLQTRLT